MNNVDLTDEQNGLIDISFVYSMAMNSWLLTMPQIHLRGNMEKCLNKEVKSSIFHPLWLSFTYSGLEQPCDDLNHWM